MIHCGRQGRHWTTSDDIGRHRMQRGTSPYGSSCSGRDRQTMASLLSTPSLVPNKPTIGLSLHILTSERRKQGLHGKEMIKTTQQQTRTPPFQASRLDWSSISSNIPARRRSRSSCPGDCPVQRPLPPRVHHRGQPIPQGDGHCVLPERPSCQSHPR